jgi:hypothetical protein
MFYSTALNSSIVFKCEDEEEVEVVEPRGVCTKCGPRPRQCSHRRPEVEEQVRHAPHSHARPRTSSDAKLVDAFDPGEPLDSAPIYMRSTGFIFARSKSTTSATCLSSTATSSKRLCSLTQSLRCHHVFRPRRFFTNVDKKE